MLVVYPSWDNPIFQEWRKWREKLSKEWSEEALEAKASIERIANHLYKDGCVVGHMIMECDLAEMAAEEAAGGLAEEGGKI